MFYSPLKREFNPIQVNHQSSSPWFLLEDVSSTLKHLGSTPWTLSCAGNFLLGIPRKPQKYMASKDLHLSGCEMKKMIERKKYASVLPYYLWSAISLKKERVFFCQLKKNNAKAPLLIFLILSLYNVETIPTINNE